jgi:hypothetical protein
VQEKRKKRGGGGGGVCRDGKGNVSAAARCALALRASRARLGGGDVARLRLAAGVALRVLVCARQRQRGAARRVSGGRVSCGGAAHARKPFAAACARGGWGAHLAP